MHSVGPDTAKPGAVEGEDFDTVLDLDSTNRVVTRRLYGDGQDDLIGRQLPRGLIDISDSAVGTLAWKNWEGNGRWCRAYLQRILTAGWDSNVGRITTTK